MLTCRSCGRDNQAGVSFCNWCGTRLNGTATGLLPSQSLLRSGRYLILEKVGIGGMGAVYRAADLQLSKRVVAIKEMSQDGLSGQDLRHAIDTFAHEAEILAHLSHPSLPHIYEQFEDNGRRYLVMEFIDGETLEEQLERCHQQGGTRLPVPRVIEIGSKLCAVLSYLHAQQPPIIFRDLKPSNIMLDARGQIYLVDFGIARLFKPGYTKDTVALGSAGYAPPEQYRRATSLRSDIYSLGVTLYQMLTGIDPTQQLFFFPPFSVNNPRLEQLVLNMVSLAEDQRPASMLTVQKILDSLLLAQLHRAKQTPPAQQPPKQASRQHRGGNHLAQSATPAKKQNAPLVAVIVSSEQGDQYLWQRLHQQVISLINGFPEIEFKSGPGRQAIDDAQLILLLLSSTFLSSSECMAAANQALDRQQGQGASLLSVILSPCQLTGTRLEWTRTTPDDAIAHLSFYAQEQRILEVAKVMRSLLVQLLLADKSNGPMNLLQWLLWQLYGNGLHSCRYFLIEPFVLEHVRPAGLAGILLHLFDLRRGRAIAEYLIGPLNCKDLLRLLQAIAPAATDPETVLGVATHRRPILQKQHLIS